MKPRLKYDGTKWVCHDNYWIWGEGENPVYAYCNWKIKETSRTRIPRRGYWNRSDCTAWFARGCVAIRSYIGNKQIYGYDPVSDELILRG